jgi:hypothetical protein
MHAFKVPTLCIPLLGAPHYTHDTHTMCTDTTPLSLSQIGALERSLVCGRQRAYMCINDGCPRRPVPLPRGDMLRSTVYASAVRRRVPQRKWPHSTLLLPPSSVRLHRVSCIVHRVSSIDHRPFSCTTLGSRTDTYQPWQARDRPRRSAWRLWRGVAILGRGSVRGSCACYWRGAVMFGRGACAWRCHLRKGGFCVLSGVALLLGVVEGGLRGEVHERVGGEGEDLIEAVDVRMALACLPW